MKSKNKIILIPILLTLSLILISQTISAATISFSNVEIVSNFQDLQGDIWKVDWTATTETESIVGFINSDNIVDQNTGWTAQHDLTIESTPIENFVEYPIDPQLTWTKIRKLSSDFKTVFTWDLNTQISQCQQNPGYIFFSWKYTSFPNPFDGDFYCITEDGVTTPVGIIRDADNTLFDIDFKVTSNSPSDKCLGGSFVGGRCVYEKTLSTKTGNLISTGTSSKIGENVWIFWKGNLLGSRLWINPDSNTELVRQKPSGWELMDAQSYQNYINNFDNPQGGAVYPKFLEECVDRWESFSSTTTPSQCVEQFNLASNDANLRVPRSSSFVAQGLNFVDETSLLNAKIRVEVLQQFIYPNFAMYVDADWIGILKPVGEPEIVSLTSSCFTEPNGMISALIKNKGSSLGSFELNLNCQPPFEGENIQLIQLSSGQSKVELLPIHATTNEAETLNTCDVTLKETTTQQVVSETLQVCVKNRATCSPSTTFCDNNKVTYCTVAGIPDITDDCVLKGERCSYENGQPVCVSETQCGDGVCGNTETISNCPSDCKTVIVQLCTVNSECNDNDPCTTDQCQPNIFGSNFCSNDRVQTPKCTGQTDLITTIITLIGTFVLIGFLGIVAFIVILLLWGRKKR